MKFNISTSYNLDVLNFMNVLTGDDFYVKRHNKAYELFGRSLSENSKRCIKKAVTIKGNYMLGPFLSLVISAVPNFNRRSLINLVQAPLGLRLHFSRYPYFNAEEWVKNEPLFDVFLPVLNELKAQNFRDYWESERLPLIKKYKNKLHTFVKKVQIGNEIEVMLGPGSTLESITVYVCTFAAPHGIKLCGPKYITDVQFPQEITVGTAVHEMFHPPYDAKSLEELEHVGKDPLLVRAFEIKNPLYGYSTMEAFIEENVVEAMALFVCRKIGLGGKYKNPYTYLETHDDGSHVLSVVLLNYFEKYPKSKNQSFQEYFRELLQVLPVGSLQKEYERIQIEHSASMKD